MKISAQTAFGQVVHILRKARNLSQDQLKGISRPFLSDIERGVSTPSLDTILKISGALKINPAELTALTVEKINGREIPDETAPVEFIENKDSKANFRYGKDGKTFNAEDVMLAATNTNTAIRAFSVLFRQSSGTDLTSVIDKKQTGAFLGAVFVSNLAETASTYLARNPSQTGHPDLIPANYLNDGKTYHWDQFPNGGVEIKTSCGNLPSGVTHELKLGAPRVNDITGIVWKGHHNQINHLLGLFWDYYAGIPTVLGGFYSNELVPDDFTNTVPKVGGGHTTNVCITKSSALKKMGQNWVFIVNNHAYIALFKKGLGIKI